MANPHYAFDPIRLSPEALEELNRYHPTLASQVMQVAGYKRRPWDFDPLEAAEFKVDADGYLYNTFINTNCPTEYPPLFLNKESTPMSTVNYSTTLFLINDAIRCIECAYEAGDNKPVKPFKTFDPEIDKGDYVVVETETRHCMTVCKVVNVDVEIDHETSQDVKWIVEKVDQGAYKHNKQIEDKAIAKIKDTQIRRRKRQFMEDLIGGNGEEIRQLEAYNIDLGPKVEEG